jgi:hypothetical protein
MSDKGIVIVRILTCPRILRASGLSVLLVVTVSVDRLSTCEEAIAGRGQKAEFPPFAQECLKFSKAAEGKGGKEKRKGN